MKNEQLIKEINKETGFWVKLKDLDNNARTGIAAKVLVEDGCLALITLLAEAPAINIYEPKNFSFISMGNETILSLKTKGHIYDWWSEDTSHTTDEYKEIFFRTWSLSKEEYRKYNDSEDVEDLPELIITGLIQESDDIF